MRAAAPLTVLALVVAVGAVSTSGPLIAYAAAPGLAIALWRNAFAAGALVPAAAATRHRELRHAGRTPLAIAVAAGVALAVHFGTWVPSVKLTTVATATALGAVQPVWQALIAALQGRRTPLRAWLGIVIAVAGAAAATGVDVSGSARAVAGDALALCGGIAVAGYTALGERARASLSTTSYTAICYGVCAAVLLAVCLVGRVSLVGYPTGTWLAIAATTLGPQLLGHSMFNYALHRVSATTVAMLVLLEVPGAGLIAWLWLGQRPPAAAWPGLALLLAGVAVVLASGPHRRPPAVLPAVPPVDPPAGTGR
ncbi:MAG: DMT family transporter [Micromonosporaceae bacterium]|nr:DMT family transporter [Micromonosporaceae bacterium]